MGDQNRTRYVSVRLTELEADVLLDAAVAGEYEVSETWEKDPDAKPGDAARRNAALTRAMAKLRAARPRQRKATPVAVEK